MADEGIAFARNLTDKFIQISLINQRNRREDARNKRFDAQLQDNRRFNQERIEIARETNRIRAAQPRTTNISVFSPGQSDDIRGFVGSSFADATRDKSGRRLIRKDKPDTISREETERIIQGIKTRAGFDFLGPAKQQQVQAEIDSIIETGFEDEDGFTVQFERPAASQGTQQSGTFPTKTRSQPTFPPFGQFGPSSIPPQNKSTFPNATQDRSTLLRRFKELGGSTNPDARKFAEDNGLLE